MQLLEHASTALQIHPSVNVVRFVGFTVTRGNATANFWYGQRGGGLSLYEKGYVSVKLKGA